MRLLRPRVRSALLALALGGGAPLAAQAIGQGFELERQGRLSDAATVYLTTLRAEPANLAALLGLERVLPGLGRLAELLPLVRRAEVTDTANLLLRALELRVYAGLNQSDSVRAAAERWIARAPGDESPWREWAVALEDQHQFDDARAVLQRGRRSRSSSPTWRSAPATGRVRRPSGARWWPRIRRRRPTRSRSSPTPPRTSTRR